MSKDNSIRDRITGRKEAESLIELAEVDGKSPAFAKGFWRAMAIMAGGHHKEPEEKPVSPVMSDDESKRFEKRLMPFGMHMGKQMNAVPIEHLVWLHERNERLTRYLRSDRGQRRQEEIIGPD